MIKAIISDLGRVIVDFDHHVCTKKLAKHCGMKENEIHQFIYMSKTDTKFDSGKISAKEFFAFVKEGLDLNLTLPEFSKIFADIFTLRKDTVKLYTSLKEKGMRFCLLSNTNGLHYNWCKKKFPFLKTFEHTVLSYKTGVMKPHPRIYMEAVNKLGLKKEECVYIDDIAEFTEAAKLLGLNAVTYKNAKQAGKELADIYGVRKL